MSTHHKIEIHFPEGVVEKHALDKKRLLLGRGPGVDIEVSSSELSPRHLLLVPKHNGCWLSVAQNAKSPAIMDGQTIDHALLRWGSCVRIGSLTLVFGKNESDSRISGSRVLIFSVATIIALVLGILATLRDTRFSTPHTELSPPKLLEQPPECPRAHNTDLSFSSALAEKARSKAQRYPFSTADGLPALILYHQAESCLRKQSLRAQADAVQSEREHFEAKLQNEYATVKAQLRKSLDEEDWHQALSELRQIKQILGDKTGPYMDWLEELERHLQAKNLNE